MTHSSPSPQVGLLDIGICQPVPSCRPSVGAASLARLSFCQPSATASTRQHGGHTRVTSAAAGATRTPASSAASSPVAPMNQVAPDAELAEQLTRGAIEAAVDSDAFAQP